MSRRFNYPKTDAYELIRISQAVPLEHNDFVDDFHRTEHANYYDYVGERSNSSHFTEYPGMSDNGESRSEVTKSIVLKAIRDLKCRSVK
jgi:hypothetical protein